MQLDDLYCVLFHIKAYIKDLFTLFIVTLWINIRYFNSSLFDFAPKIFFLKP
jgi:hypothetical protein